MKFPPAPPPVGTLESNPGILGEMDERVLFDKKSSQWIFETNEEGKSKEYRYNFILEQWIPVVEETSTGSKRLINQAMIDAEEKENKEEIIRMKKKKIKELKEADKKGGENGNARLNTGVFVSGLPEDTTKEELAQVFGKYGLISEDFVTGEPRVKLYYDNGEFKREALVIYHNPESVTLAVQMLDSTKLRASGNDEDETIRVQEADFSNTSSSVEKKVLSAEQKKLLKKKKELMQRKLADWDEEDADDKGRISDIKIRIWNKIVVVDSMFRTSEMEADPVLEFDIKEDIQKECNRAGIGNDITKISVYKESGLVTIKFSNPTLSQKCIDTFDGRYFDGLKLKASVYNGEDLHSRK